MKEKADGAAIHGQLAAIMAEVDAVGKTRRNSGQGFNFRGIEDIMDALHGVFATNKVFILSEVMDQKTEERATMKGGTLIYRVLTIRVSFVSGIDGSRETVTVVGEGMDSGDKAANKAMSAGLKYALTQTLILPYGQVDGDQDTPPEIKPKTIAATGPAAAAAIAGNVKSAHDGRTLAPGEDPAAKTPEPKPEPTKPPAATSTATKPSNAHLVALKAAMMKADIRGPDLTAYLRKRGILSDTGELSGLSPKVVTAMLEGTDKASGKNNFALIVENLKAPVLEDQDNIPF